MLEYIAPMKIALIALVILSVIVILGLIVFSFKLLRKTQKEEIAQRREMRKNAQYQVHPGVAKEHERMAMLKKELAEKEQLEQLEKDNKKK